MIQNIQALRALAALMVVGHHFGGNLNRFGVSENVLYAGASGVDIFFVISGFIMVHSISLKPIGPKSFVINRLIRVAPLYWLVTIVLGVAALSVPHMLKTVSAEPLEIVKSIFFIPYVNSYGSVTPVLHVGWTLNYEMFFYLIFSIGLYLDNSSVNRTVFFTIGSLFLLVVIGYFAEPHATILRFFTSPILIEFGMGMILSLINRHLYRIGKYGSAIILVVGLMLICILPAPTSDVSRVILWGGPALFVVLGSLALESSGVLANNRTVQLLGRSSYALYLVHPLILSVCFKVFPSTENIVLAMIYLVLILIFTVLAGIIINLFVEIPISKIFKKVTNRRMVGLRR